MAPRKDGLPIRRMPAEERARRRAAKLAALVPQYLAQPQHLESPYTPRSSEQASEMRASIMI